MKVSTPDAAAASASIARHDSGRAPSRPVQSRREKAQVSTISALNDVAPEVVAGTQFDRGYFSAYSDRDDTHGGSGTEKTNTGVGVARSAGKTREHGPELSLLPSREQK